MVRDDSALATKADVRFITEKLTEILDGQDKLRRELEERVDARIAASEERVKRHFDVAVETIRKDLVGANADEIESLKTRVSRVEQHVGLAPA
ncbi:MAG: hypothetical protein AB7O68_14625 [Pirellulales bacterium]